MLRGRIFLTTRAGKWAGIEQRRGEEEENVTFFPAILALKGATVLS